MATKRQTKKGPACTICRHPDRALIEATRVAGASLDSIAERFKVKRDAIHRHCRNHLSEEDRAAYIAAVPMHKLAERAMQEGLSLLDYFAIMRGILMQQMQLAASVNDRNGTAIVAGRLTEVLTTIGKLTGEIMKSAPVTNLNQTAIFINSPAFADLHAMLVKQLAKHPAALNAVLSGLDDLEKRARPAPKQLEGSLAHASA